MFISSRSSTGIRTYSKCDQTEVLNYLSKNCTGRFLLEKKNDGQVDTGSKITFKMFYCRSKIATQLWRKKKKKGKEGEGGKRENIISKPLAYF